MTRSGIYGIWKNETEGGGSSAVTTQTIRDDGTYETHMVFSLGAGCEQHIHHYGLLEIGDASLKLSFESGETRMTGCSDPSRNFGTRAFTEEETEEAKRLLAQEIPYSVEGDSLVMTVEGPSGPMEVVYTREGR